MNASTVYSSTHFCLLDLVECDARTTSGGGVILTANINHSAIVISGSPATVLAQLDAMRAEVVRVMAEAEAVTS